MVGIKARQAYTYISTLERLGPTAITEHASMGITKLDIIASVPATERDDLMDTPDLASLGVRDLKELADKYKQQGEQLSLLQNTAKSIDNTEEELAAKTEEIYKLQRQIKEMQSAPIEVAVAEPDEETLAKIKEEAEAEYTAKLAAIEADNDAAFERAAIAERETLRKLEDELATTKAAEEEKIKEAEAAATKAAEERIRSQLDAVESEKAAALESAAALEKKLSLSGNSDTILFKHIFDDLQGAVNKLLGIITKLQESDPDTAAKFAGALSKYIGMIDAKLGTAGEE